MGRYRVVKSDHDRAILVHEPESDTAQVIEIRHPKSAGITLPDGFAENNWYYVSLSLSRADAPVPSVVTPLPNTVLNEQHVAEVQQARTNEATGPVSGVVVESPTVEELASAEGEPAKTGS